MHVRARIHIEPIKQEFEFVLGRQVILEKKCRDAAGIGGTLEEQFAGATYDESLASRATDMAGPEESDGPTGFVTPARTKA
jgi:hypothetical protein